MGMITKATPAMSHLTSLLPTLTIGIDLGDRFSHCCCVDAHGRVVAATRFNMTKTRLERLFGPHSQLTRGLACRVVLEATTHSPWVSEVLAGLGHEVIVANPWAMVQPGGRRRRKNDKIDAEALARIGRMDVKLLAPIQHRGKEAREDLTLIRARDTAIAVRTTLINCVRGLVKTNGHRVPKCSSEASHKRAAGCMPDRLKPALMPLVDSIAHLTATIKGYDREVRRLATKKYPETQRLTQVPGVAHLTALTYVLTLEDPGRFATSRAVAPYLGLVTRQHQSGGKDPELRISKAGDKLVRKLLVTAANYILGPLNRTDSDLLRFGKALASRGRKNAKKRAVVAVARKLAVLLHALWLSGDSYEPLRQANAALKQAS